jgi:hypothetical protein
VVAVLLTRNFLHYRLTPPNIRPDAIVTNNFGHRPEYSGHIKLASPMSRTLNLGNVLIKLSFEMLMETLHSLNIGVHIVFGTVGLLLGLVVLWYQNQPRRHIRLGRYFMRILCVVIATGLVGIIFSRSNPFLLMLTLIAGYAGFSGYRTIRLREQRAQTIDVVAAVSALVGVGWFVVMAGQSGQWSPVVVYPTLSALALMAGYDLLKRLFFFNRFKTWWLYEHIYKMLSAYSALLSAFSGTVLTGYKPYSQILPSVLCLALIVFFIWQRTRKQHQASKRKPLTSRI